MPKPKILITGGTGLVGGTLLLSEKLFALFDVYATFRKQRLPVSNKVNWIQLEFSRPINQLSSVLSELKPNVIIHCAAESHVDRCADDYESCSFINIDVSVEIAKTASEIGCYFIHLSSDFVFSGEEASYSENSFRNPVNSYGITKLKAEDAVLAACPNAAIVRTVLVYGFVPTQSRNNILTWVIHSLKQGKAIKVVDDQFRKPTSAIELSDALINLAENKHQGVFHICGSEIVSVYQLAITIAKTYHLNHSLITPISSKKLNEKNLRPRNTALEIEKAKYILNYRPRPIALSILDFQSYFQS